jgi:hypothetical protein
MKFRRLLQSGIVAAVAVFFTGAIATAQHHETELKVGKTGEVTFAKETIVGQLTLKPGRYEFKHRVEGADHFVHFTEVTKPNPAYPTQPTSGQPKAHPGEVQCKLEPLDKKASTTRLFLNDEGKTQRLVRAEVGGENVAHLF